MWHRRTVSPARSDSVYPGDRPSAADLDEFVRDVRQLRLALCSDLTVAAAAVDDDHPDIAADIVAADRAEVADFSRRALGHLGAAGPFPSLSPSLAAEPVRPVATSGRPRRLLTMAPLTTAAAAAAIAIGLIPLPATNHQSAPVTNQQLVASFDAFAQAIADREGAAAIIAAANQVSVSLQPLLAAAPHDPAAAAQALEVLQAEQSVLVADQPQGAAELLSQVQALVAALQNSVRADSHAIILDRTTHLDLLAPTPTPSPNSQSSPSPSTRPKTSPSPSPSGKPSPSPSTKPSTKPSTTPSGSSSPSPSPSGIPLLFGAASKQLGGH